MGCPVNETSFVQSLNRGPAFPAGAAVIKCIVELYSTFSQPLYTEENKYKALDNFSDM